MIQYTAVIRTLGTAGTKYQALLDSLKNQTFAPKAIIVYIAEGYPLPKETIGIEKYIYVKKGMVSQRALRYNEVDTEYILFLDDDLKFSSDTVENMFRLLKEYHADVISPDIFPNAKRPFIARMMMTISGRMRARKDDGVWGYKVMRTGGYSYNSNPNKEVYISQTNAGACFLCRKVDFVNIHFEEELWLDKVFYALGEDQVMYYKMYKYGLKLLTWYNHDFIHLDAGGNLQLEKVQKLIYSDFRFKTIFWHRFIYSSQQSMFLKWWSAICILYTLTFTLSISLIKGKYQIFHLKKNAIKDAISFINSEDYKQLPCV